jgi:endonuclease/exonuclease/phosphatase family metal-dependent hydrolase
MRMGAHRSAVSGCAMACVVAALSGGAAAPALAQLRVATWNVSTYGGANAVRDPAFQSVLFDTFVPSPGVVRQFNPDVIAIQELSPNVNALNAYLAMINARAGANTYGVSPFVSGPDSVSAVFYRRSKVVFVEAVSISAGSTSPNPPRNTMRFRVRPVGYAAPGVGGRQEADLYIYSSHMKAGTTDDDKARRLVEAQRIRTNAQALPGGSNFVVLGDFNIQASVEPPPGQSFGAYTWLTQSQANNVGRVFDPISTPGVGVNGTWNNQSAMRFVHTQSPGLGTATPPTPPGMDDRFDFIMVSSQLIDRVGTTVPGLGMEYIGNFPTAYSTTTWDDPNHSYRAWGNDGTKYNLPVNNGGTNAMVGATIANALVTAATGDAAGGHVPVFLDLRVPARTAVAGSGVTSPGGVLTIDFGQVAQGSDQSRDFTVGNGGNVSLWNAAGINTLSYTLAIPTGGPTFVFDPGPLSFLAAAGAASNAHTLFLDTTTPGVFTGTLTISSNSSDEPLVTVQLMGEVLAPVVCEADCDGSGALSPADFTCFLGKYRAGDPTADCDASGGLSPADFTCFLGKYRVGCP